jgi:hypothetical protein
MFGLACLVDETRDWSLEDTDALIGSMFTERYDMDIAAETMEVGHRNTCRGL